MSFERLILYMAVKMTDIQIKFLDCIYKEDLTAKELCKKLKIKGDKIDNLGVLQQIKSCYKLYNHR